LPKFDHFINWAGWIPEDISYEHLAYYLEKSKIYLHYGTADQFITDESVKGINEVIASNHLKITVSKFEGEHRIPNEELVDFLDRYVLPGATPS